MKYWDSSALVTLVVEQKASGPVRKLYADDPQLVSWSLSDVEVVSALCRLARENAFRRVDLNESLARLELLWKGVTTVSALEGVKTRARRLLRSHSLRAADALQLAAALMAAYDDPLGLEFVCLDDRLRDAASVEGFRVRP